MLGSDQAKIDEDYHIALSKIYQSETHRRQQLGMVTLQDFAQKLNNPHKKYKTIHITGTNGKGSVTYKLASALRITGYNTGLFQSPHISCFRQRIKVNGQMISKEDLIYFSNQVTLELMKNPEVKLNFFQKTCFIAFLYFASKNVDVAVIEVGVGGSFDSTNIVSPCLSVITSIGLDHIQYLGPTQQDIARNKAGIIKKDTPVVIGPYCEPVSVVYKKAQEMKSYVIQVQKNKDTHDFKDINNQIVKLSLYHLREKIFTKVRKEVIDKVMTMQQPCRMQRVPAAMVNAACEIGLSDEQLNVFMDVGHNISAIERVIKGIRSKMKVTHQLWVVCSFSENKKTEDIFQYIGKKTHKLFLVSTDHFRLKSAEALYEQAKSAMSQLYKQKTKIQDLIDGGAIVSSIKQAAKMAQESININNKCKKVNLLILGSFFIMQEIRTFFGYKEVRDIAIINYSGGKKIKN